MKKSISILLVLLLIVATLLTACDTGSDTSSTNDTTPGTSDNGGSGGGNGGGGGGGNKPDTPTAGYSFKTIDNRLRIEYPSTWEDQTEDEAFCCMETYSFSILNVYADVSSYWYDYEFNENFDESDLLESFQQYDSMEFKKLERLDNANGVTVNTISFSYQMNQTMIMYLFEVKIDEIYYEIQLMMPEGNDIIAQTVFDSITDVSTTPDSGNGGDHAPEGYLTLSRYNLSFIYPEAWAITSTTHRAVTITHNTSKILLYSGPITTVFSEITKEQFLSENVPNIEEEKGGKVDNVSVEHTTNANGLAVTLISYSITVQNETTWLFGAFVTIDQSSHALELSSNTKEEELFLTILNSMKAIDGPNYTPESENNSESNTSPSPDDPFPSDPSNPSNNEQEIYREAKDFYKNGDYEKAYALFSQIPDYPGVDAYLDELEKLMNSNDSSSKNEK